MQRSAGGLRVNVMPYRKQPLVFWKEMLKELMHSMGMSLVREKAVGNFIDRLHKGVHTAKATGKKKSSTQNHPLRQVQETRKPHHQHHHTSDKRGRINVEQSKDAVVDGWIELRKGFHSLLLPDGDLVIFRSTGIQSVLLHRVLPRCCC